MNESRLAELLDCLRTAFPSLTMRRDLQRRSHEEWVELRPGLPRVVASEVPVVLPFVLADMARHAE